MNMSAGRRQAPNFNQSYGKEFTKRTVAENPPGIFKTAHYPKMYCSLSGWYG